MNKYFTLDKGLAIEIEPWQCPRCTYLNDDHYYRCTLCGEEDDEFHLVNKAEAYKQYNKISRVKRVFGRTTKILLPVLACHNLPQFQENISRLYPLFQDRKIFGIWLISSNTDNEVLIETINWIRLYYPDLWVGINLVGENIIKVLKFVKKNNPDGIWIDNSNVSDHGYQNLPNILIDQIKRMNWKGLYFGGVLFKYIAVTGDPEKIVENASQYMDVLTTSGKATGVPIELEKLQFIQQHKKDILVAVASGIDADNINELKHYCQIFIVRSSIVDKDNNIQLEKLDKLINNLQG